MRANGGERNRKSTNETMYQGTGQKVEKSVEKNDEDVKKENKNKVIFMSFFENLRRSIKKMIEKINDKYEQKKYPALFKKRYVLIGIIFIIVILLSGFTIHPL